uniref:Uncharacterized protein LOC110204110 n=1 Tax=Phascolarctos cinereus TaxID=38626 RepID=A0A6P5JRV8_PHACI
IARKIPARVLLDRLIVYLEDGHLPDTQCGFRKDQEMVNMVFAAPEGGGGAPGRKVEEGRGKQGGRTAFQAGESAGPQACAEGASACRLRFPEGRARFTGIIQVQGRVGLSSNYDTSLPFLSKSSPYACSCFQFSVLGWSVTGRAGPRAGIGPGGAALPSMACAVPQEASLEEEGMAAAQPARPGKVAGCFPKIVPQGRDLGVGFFVLSCDDGALGCFSLGAYTWTPVSP